MKSGRNLHLPLTARSRGLIGAPELPHMKRRAPLVNCARGGVVDEAALLDALERGHLGAVPPSTCSRRNRRQTRRW
ncbi:MAG TPA: NAD(P)-dependent oxidoreductase [Longimicrobiaceae bacterium]|nr:NAD(P)-dependent oxidoreductase [Longimicrobiaceae bacterium]